MTWWQETNGQLAEYFNGREGYMEAQQLADIGAFWGPAAQDVKRAFPNLVPGALTNKPWDKAEAANTVGIGVNNTWWVLDPKSPAKGVWVLNASSTEASKAAMAVKSPTIYGWYIRTSEEIPKLFELNEAGFKFQPGFTEAYYKFYPQQDPRPKAKPKGPPVRTYEVVGMLGGIPVPLTDVVRYVGGSDYELAPGAALAVTDDPEDGFNLAGAPGKWDEIYGGQSPAQFGLDRDKGVLFYNGKTGQGQALPAQVLFDWYGASWRREIYGAR